MTIGLGVEELRRARRDGRSVVAAVVYDTVGINALVGAAERTEQPVIAQVGSSAFQHLDASALVAAVKSVASESPASVGLHLDHGRDLDEINRCLDWGYSSVMIDGSRLDFDQNVELSAAAVELAKPYGAWVEAELGRIEGHEDRSLVEQPTASDLTDPSEANRFVNQTGVDALAVCIGNVHGQTYETASLDLDLLGRLADAVAVPLVLHGASGVSEETLVRCAQLGVAKVNFNAELRAAYLRGVEEVTSDGSDDLVGAFVAARGHVEDLLISKIELLSSEGRRTRGGP